MSRAEGCPGPYGGGAYIIGGGSAAEVAERLNYERVISVNAKGTAMLEGIRIFSATTPWASCLADCEVRIVRETFPSGGHRWYFVVPVSRTHILAEGFEARDDEISGAK